MFQNRLPIDSLEERMCLQLIVVQTKLWCQLQQLLQQVLGMIGDLQGLTGILDTTIEFQLPRMRNFVRLKKNYYVI